MALNQQTATTKASSGLSSILTSTLLVRILALVGFLGFVWLAVYNLEYSPVTWFDEGEHLRVPKTLIQSGQYAVWSVEGFRYFGPTIGVGPTVLLPIALVFQFFGIGLVQGRAVIVLYLLVATLLYWLYARKLLEKPLMAALALVVLCAAPGADYIALGRQGLGEIPALAFMLAGLYFWYKVTDSPTRAWNYVLLAGLFWSLATITKSNYGLLIPPTLVLVWLLNHFYYRQLTLNWKVFAAPLIMVVGSLGLWYLIILLFLGGGDFNSNLNLLRTATGGSAFVFSIPRMQSALKFLFSPDSLFGLAVPGMLYGIWLVRKPVAGSFKLVMPLAFAAVWLGWFGFASVGWPRYAFAGLVVCTLFTTRLIWDLPALLSLLIKKPDWQKYLKIGVGLAVVALLVWGFVPQIKETATVNDGAQKLAAYLNQNVKTSAVIETWESEMGFLTNHSYHYPPPEMLDKAVRLKWLNGGGQSLPELYQPEKLTPDYLIDGVFSQWNGLYPAKLLAEHYQFVGSFGNYNLYRRVS